MATNLACPDCKSTNIVKFGKKWVWDRDNTSNNHHRIKRQQYICNTCGRITVYPIQAQNRDTKGRFVGNCISVTPKSPVINYNTSHKE